MSRVPIVLLALLILANAGVAQFTDNTLPKFGEYESRRVSSYDQSGGNGDYRRLKAGEKLGRFAEAGPPKIRHLWITMVTSEAYHLKKVVLRMYWDGEADPSVETLIGFFLA